MPDITRLNEAAKRYLKGAKAYVGTEHSQDGDAQALADAWLVFFDPTDLKDVKVALGTLSRHAGRFQHECRAKGHAGNHIRSDGLSVWCGYCGDSLGWHCPDSPDGVCHYADEEDTTYQLLDGTIQEVPIAPHGYRFFGENCVICGEPEERK